MRQTQCLLMVDVQNDFCPGGSLAVADGDQVVPALNRYVAMFAKRQCPMIASRDWHPARTKHFKDFGGPWPVHCVQNTPGAAFHPSLKLPREAIIVSKGMEPDKDSYSAFQAIDGKGRALLNVLKEAGVRELFIGGLATDYCVKASVLDALQHFSVRLLIDAIKGVDIHPGDSQKAMDEMFKGGASPVTLKDVEDSLA